MKRTPWSRLPVMLCVGAALFAAFASRSAAQPLEHPDAICLDAPYGDADSPEEARIRALSEWLDAVLSPYPELTAALEEGAPEICLTDALFGVEGYLGLEDNRIVLRRSLSEGMLRAVAIHEVRHLHHAWSGACPGHDLSMDEFARVTLALEADASATSLAIAWELREGGDPAVWEALADWSTHADLASVFETEMARSQDLARATARAFIQWYASDWRRNSYHHAACSDFLEQEDRTHALRRYGEADPDFLAQICRLPDGRAYPCEEPAEAR